MTRMLIVRTAAICLLVLLIVSCKEQSSAPAKPSTSSGPSHQRLIEAVQLPNIVRERLRIETASVRIVPETVTAPGEVGLDLKRVSKVAPRIEGKVEHLYAFVGERVAVGQPLVAIGSPRLDELVQEYLVSKAQSEAAESNFRRTEKLSAEGITSERRLVEERGRYLEGKARFQHTREKLLNMGLTAADLRELEKAVHEESHRYILKSPIAGTIVKQNVVLGQGVSPGAELFVVVDTSQVWVYASLPVEQARRFKVGDIGTIVPKGGEPLKAALTYVAPVADETTRTIRMRMDVANTGERLKPNEYVDVQLTYEGPPVLAVPASGVIMVEQTRGVFVEQGTGYRFVPIGAGREDGGFVEIRNGLHEGDRVVTSGVFDLKNVLLKETIQEGEGE